MHESRQLCLICLLFISLCHLFPQFIHCINMILRNFHQLCSCLQHGKIQQLIRNSRFQLQNQSQLCLFYLRKMLHPVLIPDFCMILIDIIDQTFQSIQHPFCIIIANLHILPAFPAVKLKNTSQPDSRSDPVDLCVLGQLYPRLTPRSINPYLNNILTAPLYERTKRHIVHHATVNVSLSTDCLILKT